MMSETKHCRVCKVEKALSEFYPNRQRYHQPSYGTICRPCSNAKWLARYHLSKRARIAYRHQLKEGIPPSDPRLDLEVVDVCWSDCVREGPAAITRMVKRLTAICWRLSGSDRLSCAAVGYLDGTNSLAMVRDRLDELVSLARSA